MRALASKIKPIRDHVLVRDMNFGAQTTQSGIYIPSDDGKSEGIKPRWCQVFAVGAEQKEITVGEWIFVEHGRWTRGVEVVDDDGNEFTIRRVENTAILLSADERPNTIEFGQFKTPEHGSTHRAEDFIRY
jgi:co-chaperonin GroES (HSP10)